MTNQTELQRLRDAADAALEAARVADAALDAARDAAREADAARVAWEVFSRYQFQEPGNLGPQLWRQITEMITRAIVVFLSGRALLNTSNSFTPGAGTGLVPRGGAAGRSVDSRHPGPAAAAAAYRHEQGDRGDLADPRRQN